MSSHGVHPTSRSWRSSSVPTPAHEEQVNVRLCKAICAQGNVYLSTTRLPREGLVLRACVLHHRTDEAVVNQLVMDTVSSIASVG